MKLVRGNGYSAEARCVINLKNELGCQSLIKEKTATVRKVLKRIEPTEKTFPETIFLDKDAVAALACHVCTEVRREVVSPACGHVVCLKCLTQWSRSKEVSEEDRETAQNNFREKFWRDVLCGSEKVAYCPFCREPAIVIKAMRYSQRRKSLMEQQVSFFQGPSENVYAGSLWFGTV